MNGSGDDPRLLRPHRVHVAGRGVGCDKEEMMLTNEQREILPEEARKMSEKLGCNKRAEWMVYGDVIESESFTCTEHLSMMVADDTTGIAVSDDDDATCCFICQSDENMSKFIDHMNLLEDQLRATRGVLKDVEWCCLGHCPVCGEDHSSGHLGELTRLERGPCKLAKNLPPKVEQ